MTLFFTKHNARHPDLFQNLRKYSFCRSFLIAVTHARHVLPPIPQPTIYGQNLLFTSDFFCGTNG